MTKYQRYHRKLREIVLTHYGEQCAYCGSTQSLQIDHKDGKGAEWRKANFGTYRVASHVFYRWLIKHGFPEGYQTLCGYHNDSKGDRSDAEYRTNPQHLESYFEYQERKAS